MSIDLSTRNSSEGYKLAIKNSEYLGDVSVYASIEVKLKKKPKDKKRLLAGIAELKRIVAEIEKTALEDVQ